MERTIIIIGDDGKGIGRAALMHAMASIACNKLTFSCNTSKPSNVDKDMRAVITSSGLVGICEPEPIVLHIRETSVMNIDCQISNLPAKQRWDSKPFYCNIKRKHKKK